MLHILVRMCTLRGWIKKLEQHEVSLHAEVGAMLDIGVEEVADPHQMFKLWPIKRQLDPEEQAL